MDEGPLSWTRPSDPSKPAGFQLPVTQFVSDLAPQSGDEVASFPAQRPQ